MCSLFIQTEESPTISCFKSLYSLPLFGLRDSFIMCSQHRNQNVCPTFLLLLFKRSTFLTDMQRTWLKVGEPFSTPLQLGRAGNYFSSLSKKHFTLGWHDNDIRALLGSFWGSWKVKAFQLKTQSWSFTLSLTLKAAMWANPPTSEYASSELALYCFPRAKIKA